MTKIAVPPGYALVRVADLAALQAARADSSPAPAPPDPEPVEATLAGLAEAIGILTARANGQRLPLSGDVAPTAVTGALAVIACAALAQLLPADRGARLLADLGLAAVREEAP